MQIVQTHAQSIQWCFEFLLVSSPQYAESRETRAWLNAPLHNSAAVLAAEQLRRVLAEPAQEGRDSVLLVTGIPGAGKTSMVLDAGFTAGNAHAVYEGQLSNPKVALEKVGQVLDAGFQPVIMVVHAQPERALDNTLNRYETLGRGASIGLMANLQAGLPDGLKAVQSQFGDRVSLQIIDRRNFDDPVLVKGWDQLRVLESEGNHEQITQRLATHLESRRQTLSDAAYRQAAGIEPERAGGQHREAGAEERSPAGDRREAAAGNSKAVGLKPRPPLGTAFDELARPEAVTRYPELSALYADQDRFEAALMKRFPNDERSRKAYASAVRAEVIRKLDAGQVPIETVARPIQREEGSAVARTPDLPGPRRAKDSDLER